MSIEAEPIGRAAMLLGAGRDRTEDSVDPGVGILLRVITGERVKAGEAIAELYGRDDEKIAAAELMVRSACWIGDGPPATVPLIRERLN
jgi:thymidine phosphorylase